MIEQYNIISSTAAGGVPTSTAKIETPEEFAQTIKDNAFDPRCWIPGEEMPTGYFDIKEAAQIIAARDTAIRAESAALLKMCEEALEAVESLIKESDGVYGLHLNGSPAPWDELRTGAYFEEWLLPFDKALAALAERAIGWLYPKNALYDASISGALKRQESANRLRAAIEGKEVPSAV